MAYKINKKGAKINALLDKMDSLEPKATRSSDGFMSASDKEKLEDLPSAQNLIGILAEKQDVITDLPAIRSGAEAGASAYQKPGTGIPASDLSSEVQDMIENGGKTKSVSVNGGTPVTPDENGQVDLTVPSKTSDLENDSDFATKQEAQQMVDDAKIDTVSVDYQEDGGAPDASASFEDGELAFSLKNMKMKFSDLTPEERATLKGDKGDQGDSAVYDPSSPDAPDFEMANTIGQSTTKAMTQKAVTDELNKVNDNIGVIREMDGWVESDLSATHLTDGLRNIIVVKVNEGDIIKVKAQSGKAASGALVSTLEITGGHWSALKEDNTAATSRFNVSTSGSIELTVPASARFFVANGRSEGGYDYTPEILINGRTPNLADNVNNISDEVFGKTMTLYGNNSNWSKKDIVLQPGETYRITLGATSWPLPSSIYSTEYVFAINSVGNDDTLTAIIGVQYSQFQSIRDYYDITVPATNCKAIRIGFRAIASFVLGINIKKPNAPTLDDVEYQEIEDIVFANSGAIGNDGVLIETNNYSYTDPFYVSEDTKYIYYYGGRLFCPISMTDENGTIHTPIINDYRNPPVSLIPVDVEIKAGSYICFCNYASEFTPRLYKINKLKSLIDGESMRYSMTNGYAILEDLSIIVQSAYSYTSPIKLRKGDFISVKAHGGLISVISESDSNGNLIRSLASEPSSTTVYGTYEYAASSDCYVVVCYRNDLSHDIKLNKLHDHLGFIDDRLTEPCGIYLYPFRTIANKHIYLYKDSIVSGLKPTCNYEIYCPKTTSQLLSNHSKYNFHYKAAAGTNNVTIIVKDKYNKVAVSKTVAITTVNRPSVKLSTRDDLYVMFMGDSMIGKNYNLVGAEYLRMLNTLDSETHTNTDKSIQLPTLNVCNGKMHLVGELQTSDGVHESAPRVYTHRLQQWLTGKRNFAYGASQGQSNTPWFTYNPFYNPDSTASDTVGEDGFNQRVDFAWYWENAIGAGKYPNLIYIAIGANDIADTYNWGFQGIGSITANLVALCQKMKSVADSLAGGEADFKIKIFNHQTYPLFSMDSHNFPILQQRLVWNKLYDSYYAAIKDLSYVELVDCASRFDWRVGYSKSETATNPRYNGNQDEQIEESCHMNVTGAYNYADCLIDDFLADHDYD